MSIFSFFNQSIAGSEPYKLRTFGKRHFLKNSLLVIAGIVLGPKWVMATEKHPQWTMVIDLNRCIGCQSCVIACKAQSATIDEQFNIRIRTEEVKNPPSIRFIPVLCNHCENAPCIKACPREATFRRDDGIVITDWDSCDGSGDCVPACPFDARFLDFSHGNRSDKCDFCIDRILKGLVPACVEACAPKAIIFGDASAPSEELSFYLMQNELEVNRPELNLRGSVFYLPLKKSKHKERG